MQHAPNRQVVVFCGSVFCRGHFKMHHRSDRFENPQSGGKSLLSIFWQKPASRSRSLHYKSPGGGAECLAHPSRTPRRLPTDLFESASRGVASPVCSGLTGADTFAPCCRKPPLSLHYLPTPCSKQGNPASPTTPPRLQHLVSPQLAPSLSCQPMFRLLSKEILVRC